MVRQPNTEETKCIPKLPAWFFLWRGAYDIPIKLVGRSHSAIILARHFVDRGGIPGH